jgi:hypothetical protein
MMTSTVYRLLMGMLCLVLWPGVIAAYGDWRIEQAQERLKAAGFDPGYIDGVLGVSDERCTPPLSGQPGTTNHGTARRDHSPNPFGWRSGAIR